MNFPTTLWLLPLRDPQEILAVADDDHVHKMPEVFPFLCVRNLILFFPSQMMTLTEWFVNRFGHRYSDWSVLIYLFTHIIISS